MEQITMTIGDKIKEAMDGRSQRWLSIKAVIPETDLSRKLQGKIDFTQEEIDRINTALKTKLKLA